MPRERTNDPGLQIFPTANSIVKRTVWKLPEEGVAAEIAAPDVVVGTEIPEGPQLDLDFRTIDPPYAVRVTAENVSSCVQPCRQPPGGAGNDLDISGQDKVEINAIPPQQPIANIAARDVALRRAETLPHPAQEQVAFERVWIDIGHCGPRIVD